MFCVLALLWDTPGAPGSVSASDPATPSKSALAGEKSKGGTEMAPPLICHCLLLRFLLADFGFVDRLIEMFDGFDAMSMKVMGGGFQFVLGVPHGF